MKLNQYRVAWRSKDGKDYGLHTVDANDKDDARGWYEANYPHHRVTSVTLEKQK